jgi:hypothetical protein
MQQTASARLICKDVGHGIQVITWMRSLESGKSLGWHWHRPAQVSNAQLLRQSSSLASWTHADGVGSSISRVITMPRKGFGTLSARKAMIDPISSTSASASASVQGAIDEKHRGHSMALAMHDPQRGISVGLHRILCLELCLEILVPRTVGLLWTVQSTSQPWNLVSTACEVLNPTRRLKTHLLIELAIETGSTDIKMSKLKTFMSSDGRHHVHGAI